MFNVALKQIGDKFKIVVSPIYMEGRRSSLKRFTDTEDKLVNNISRARSKIFELAYCNYFNFFVTLTISPDHNRRDLNWARTKTTQIIRDLRKKYDYPFNFILIPEEHKDGSVHMHGLFDASFLVDFYINDKGHWSWKSYDNIGFCNIQFLNELEYENACKYITKYIRKDIAKVGKGCHCYFRSNGLRSSETLLSGICLDKVKEVGFDYENDFCKVKEIEQPDLVMYYNYIYDCIIEFY